LIPPVLITAVPTSLAPASCLPPVPPDPAGIPLLDEQPVMLSKANAHERPNAVKNRVFIALSFLVVPGESAPFHCAVTEIVYPPKAGVTVATRRHRNRKAFKLLNARYCHINHIAPQQFASTVT
jgi:hypothetical protein